MGNGYTFELETLIFYAAGVVALKRNSLPVTRRNLTVYGDDIIVNDRAVPELYRILSNLGFTVNKAKSFIDGAFRESCGGDFFMGHSVKGFYVKTFTDTPWDYFHLHNSLSMYLDDVPGFRALQNWCRRQVPRNLQNCRGPSQLGDVCFWDEHAPSKTVDWIRYYKTYQPVARPIYRGRGWTLKYREEEMLAAVLLGMSTEGPMAPVDGLGEIRWVPQS